MLRPHHSPLTGRLLVALACGFAAALVVWFARIGAEPSMAADFTWWWRAGDAMRHGLDPYAVINPVGPFPYNEGFLYPLTTALLSVPFSWMPMGAGQIVFAAVTTTVLAYALTHDGYWRLPVLMSLPMLTAVQSGQWVPVVVAAALIPSLGWLASVKPTLAAAIFLRRPSWLLALTGGMFTLATVALWPWWPRAFLAEIAARTEANYHVPILVMPVGPLLALAALRWRDERARIVLAMACVPQTMLFYDQLPLALVPRTFRQSLVWSLASYLPMVAWRFFPAPADGSQGAMLGAMARVLVVVMYLPALAMALTSETFRQSEGPLLEIRQLVPAHRGDERHPEGNGFRWRRPDAGIAGIVVRLCGRRQRRALD